MTFEELKKAYADYPDMISHSIKMSEPNEPILIHKGIFQLKKDNDIIEFEGEIKFDWFPSTGTSFQGIVKNTSEAYLKLINGFSTFQLYIENLSLGDCIISNFSLSDQLYAEGSMVSTTVKGDKTIPVSKIRFTLPNFIDFIGTNVKSITKSGLHACKHRMIFKNEEYEILLDKRADYDKLYKALEVKGGYINLYNGEITKLKGNISYENTQELIYSFATFLNFLNGKRCSPLFFEGLHEEEIIWTDYSDRFIDQHKFVPSWPYKHNIDGLNELWQNFSLLWKEEKIKDFLTTAVHWYIETNKQSGFSEGSIIMAQANLELIYNWLIIETKKLLIGKDSENISAANKIRLLLSHLSINPEIPNELAQLKAFSDFIDGPDAIVQIRNALVHGQEEKRKKLTLISHRIKYEALNLAIWYIELALLYILRYKGIYLNRCKMAPFIDGKAQYVPWIQVSKSKS